MPSIEYDRRYLTAGLEVMEAYLLSNELFWPIGAAAPEGEPDYPRLTLDGMLLARARLEAHPMATTEKTRVDRLRTDLEALRTKWRTAWEKKADQCFHSRVRM